MPYYGGVRPLQFGLNRRDSGKYWIAHLFYPGPADSDANWMQQHEEDHRVADHHQRRSDESEAIMNDYYASLPPPAQASPDDSATP
ncbi:hypothetical protein CR152_23200 [Massilia violaceinigra]|uniref:Uncharacterized protein n=1 Tax=Massilia violaceinigra TaxID=2045208 RepID=A0A2D2DQ35_9BURK|nr:hypothetical protein CR152_23200 [Massilia violaceinigra]